MTPQLKRPQRVLSESSTFEELLRYFRIGPTDWDALIIGDGSGQTWATAIGWGSVLVDRLKMLPETFSGACSHGTNNVAELMAVLHPLMYLSNTDCGVRSGGLRVHILSDSEYVVNGLACIDPIWVSKLKANRELWMAIHMTRRKGMVLTGHHVDRDTVNLQKFAHSLANASRILQASAADALPPPTLDAAAPK